MEDGEASSSPGEVQWHDVGAKRRREAAASATDRRDDAPPMQRHRHHRTPAGGASSSAEGSPYKQHIRSMATPLGGGSDRSGRIVPQLSMLLSPSAVRQQHDCGTEGPLHIVQDWLGGDTGTTITDAADASSEPSTFQPATPKPRKTPDPTTPTLIILARRHDSTPLSAAAKPTIDKQCQTEPRLALEGQQRQGEAPSTSTVWHHDVMLEERIAALGTYHRECNRVERVFLRACLANGSTARVNTIQSIELRRSWLESEELAEMAIVARLALLADT